MRTIQRGAARVLILAFVMMTCIAVVSGNSCDLRIVSNPQGARVTLDGVEAGTTPVTIPSVQYGEHIILLIKAGYEDLTKTIKVNTSSKTLSYPLNPVKGVIKVNSVPNDATVYLNGEKKDKKTPVTFQVPAGSFTIALTKDGYKRYETTVNVQIGEEKSINAELITQKEPDQNKGGKVPVKIISHPEGAQIGIDGFKEEERTPATIEVIPGDHYVTLLLEGYEPYREEIAFPDEKVDIYLIKKTGETITITANPDDAEISLDGVVKGKHSPLTVDNVTYGKHTIDARKAGYVMNESGFI